MESTTDGGDDGSPSATSSGGVGSSPGNGGGSAGAAFVGTWQCTVTVNLTGAGPPQTVQAVLDIIASGGGISVSGAADGGTGCPTTASVSGSTATFAPNQVCSEDGGVATLTSGTFSVSGNTLTLSVSFVSMTNSVRVSGTENGTCTRQ